MPATAASLSDSDISSSDRWAAHWQATVTDSVGAVTVTSPARLSLPLGLVRFRASCRVLSQSPGIQTGRLRVSRPWPERAVAGLLLG